jgi:hypothetical protein
MDHCRYRSFASDGLIEEIMRFSPTQLAAFALLFLGVMNLNEEAKRQFDFTGLTQTWLPIGLGAWLIFK